MQSQDTFFAFYTASTPQIEAFLDQVTQKLGGKRFTSNNFSLCVFHKASRTCHGAMYFLKKILAAGKPGKIIVFQGAQTKLLPIARDLYTQARDGHCLVTQAIQKELEQLDADFEEAGQWILEGQSTPLYSLTRYNDIAIETPTEEDFFDYSQAVVPENPKVEQPEAATTMVEEDDVLEISEVNQIYDLEQEQKLQKLKQAQVKDEGPKEAIPSYAASQIQRVQQEQIEEEPIVATDTLPEVSKAEVPIPNINPFNKPPKNRWKEPKNLIMLGVGGLSLLLILIFAMGGSETHNSDLTQENSLAETSVESPLVSEEVVIPPKRSFTPILTQDEDNQAQQTLFPQEIGDNTAFLEIKSAPPGATVTINGATLKGETPFKTFLVYANTPLHIVLHKKGYDPIDRMETIAPGDRRGFMFEMIKID